MGPVKFFVLAIVVSQAVLVHFTDASKPCGEERYPCKRSDQRCRQDKCECRKTEHGVVHLGCFPQRKYRYCQMTSDPRGQLFSRMPETPIDLPVPCQFVAAHYTARKNQWKCEVKLSTVEQRQQNKGKFFVSGFLAEVTYKRRDQNPVMLALKATGSAMGGKYAYQLQVLKDGSWSRPSSVAGDLKDFRRNNKLGNNVIFRVEDENRVHLELQRCGLDMYFRAMDFSENVATVTELPGILMGVNEFNYDITYKVDTYSFCMSTNPNDPDKAKESTGLVDYADTFLYRALVSSYNTDRQEFNEDVDAAQCSAAGKVAFDCKQKPVFARAFEACAKFLQNANFARCYSNMANSGDLVALMADCLRCYCDDDKEMCDKVESSIVKRKCDHVYKPTV